MSLQQHFNGALMALRQNFNDTSMAQKNCLGVADVDNFFMVFLIFYYMWNKDGGSHNVNCKWGWLHFLSLLKGIF